MPSRRRVLAIVAAALSVSVRWRGSQAWRGPYVHEGHRQLRPHSLELRNASSPSACTAFAAPRVIRDPRAPSGRLAGDVRSWHPCPPGKHPLAWRAVGEDSESLSNVFDAATWAVLAVTLGSLVSMGFSKRQLYEPSQCLPGRAGPIDAAPRQGATHFLFSGRPLYPPFPEDTELAMFAMGCFWCSENIFMRLSPLGIFSTAVGYAGGVTPNPTYNEVCTGRTNHAEVVRVVFRPSEITYEELLRKFWEAHDPTTENRQGNDFGTPYRSAIYYYSEEQRLAAELTRAQFQEILKLRGGGDPIVTEIQPAGEFYYAEAGHQQYDARGNAGYCGLRPTGASFSEFPVMQGQQTAM